MVEMRWPETFITSSIRPISQKSPSSSSRAPSPKKYTLSERLEPGDPARALLSPELFEAPVVDVGLRVGLPGELGRGRIPALLQEQRLDRVSGRPLGLTS